ncbi:Scr1 family TA system antitoxin-like transcriptional regulator [Nocardia higoensis]|uniref:Scr1 family TA system antitoxin-like transcriptional regulator n=1 Tax=Nocardia higoensis TaxID=228599 RepID=UPI003A5CD717
MLPRSCRACSTWRKSPRPTTATACGGISPPVEPDHRVAVRLNRQRIITRKRSPVQVNLLLDETVVRRAVGGARTMAGQLHNLAALPANVHLAAVQQRIPPGRGMRLPQFGGNSPQRRSTMVNMWIGLCRRARVFESNGARPVPRRWDRTARR